MNKTTINGLSKVAAGGTMLEPGIYDWNILDAVEEPTSNGGTALKLSCECIEGMKQSDETSPIGLKRTIMLWYPSENDTSPINLQKLKSLLDATSVEIDEDDGFDHTALCGRTFRCRVQHRLNPNKGRTYENFDMFKKIPVLNF